MREETRVCFGPFRLDLADERVWHGQEVCKLTRKAFAVLRYLVEHPGRLVTKEELFTAVWPEVVVGDATLAVCVRELRRVLDDTTKPVHYIETVHGRGYRWIAPLSPVSPVQGAKFKVQGFPPAPSTPHPAPKVIGRETELARLHQLLDKALHGERQIVFVTGEPGIGKTTIVDAFVAQASTDSSLRIGRGQCIDLHGAGEPYMPVLEALSRLCRGPAGDHLITLLHQYAPTWLVQMPTLLSADELAALQPKVQGATRERMLRELAEAIETVTAEHPLVLVLEDLHWSDPSTVDVLAALARRREPARLLVLGTYRPVEMLDDGHSLNRVLQELQGHNLCVELDLKLLTTADVETYLHLRFPASALPTALARTLYQRTEGNPLFLVNVVEDLVTRGSMVQEDGGWTLQGGLEAIEGGAPKSIRQLIARQSARLLPAEQQMLEAASMAGMEFSAAAVAAALEESTVAIEEQCAGLVNRQHFLRLAGLSEWPDGTLAARYTFLHALYQELWHERVSPSRLQQFHLRIGERKEAAYGAQKGEIAAELALHFEQGRDYRRATHYLQQAAQNALRRSANIEAIQYLTKALEVLKTLPDTPERTQQELNLQITLGVPLQATKGFAAPEVERAYARAQQLCQQVGETLQLFRVLSGLWFFYLARAELQTAHEFAEQLLSLAQHVQDPAFLVEAHRALGATLWHLGEFASAQKHFEQGIALYDAEAIREAAQKLHLDVIAWMLCRDFAALSLWLLGYPDQALKSNQETLTLARELSHSFSVGYALDTATWIHQFRRESQAAQERAEAEIAFCTEQGFTLISAEGAMIRGWALVEQGEEEGLVQIRQGLATWSATGAEMSRLYFLILLVEAYKKAGQAEEGLNILSEALTLVSRTGERFYEAEVYRLKGELTLQQENQKAKGKRQKSKVEPSTQPLTPITQEAEACFHKAIEIARQQQAKSLELRAVTSLARLWRQHGKRREAAPNVSRDLRLVHRRV